MHDLTPAAMNPAEITADKKKTADHLHTHKSNMSRAQRDIVPRNF